VSDHLGTDPIDLILVCGLQKKSLDRLHVLASQPIKQRCLDYQDRPGYECGEFVGRCGTDERNTCARGWGCKQYDAVLARLMRQKGNAHEFRISAGGFYVYSGWGVCDLLVQYWQGAGRCDGGGLFRGVFNSHSDS